MYSILQGIRVIEGSAFVAAPLGGMSLAQLGADVIRFDQIGGGLDYRRWPVTKDGNSIYWTSLNRGKRSIAIDLREQEGKELVQSLITEQDEKAGVFLTNFPSRGWSSYESLSTIRSDLIQINIEGNNDGSSTVDYTVNCATGLPYITGTASSESPVNSTLPSWDVACGLYAALAAVSALLKRQQSGEGTHAKIALSDVAMATMGNLGYLSEAQLNDKPREAIGNNLYGAFGRDFPSSDNGRVMIVAITLRQWQNLVKAADIEFEIKQLEEQSGLNLDLEGERYRAHDEISQLVENWTTSMTLADLRRTLDEHAVCWGEYQTMQEMLENDPRCSVENNIFEMINDPLTGEQLAPATPIRFQGKTRGSVPGAPLLGQHTNEILSSVLGLNDSQIGDLHQRGIVAGT